MREHCYHGYQMLKKIPFLAEACEIVYAHQEHFDGSGYPRGLKGDEIPLGARVSPLPTLLMPSSLTDLIVRPDRSPMPARRSRLGPGAS